MAKNTLAVEQKSSEEGKTHGQSDRNETPSLFWFPVYEGLFEHASIISNAVWLFMWLIARTTREKDGSGSVLGGVPIHDGRPAGELGFPIKTVRRWRRMLVAGGYIAAVRTPYGFKYTLMKSKKWQKGASRDCPILPISPEESARFGQSKGERVPVSGSQSARSGQSNKTIQGLHRKEEAEEAATTALSTEEKTQNQRHPGAWEDIWIEPCGTLKFVLTWEQTWGDSKEGELWSVVMERCIQKCQSGRIQVPRRFYERKHRIEDTEEPEEIRRVAGPRGIPEESMR
jgi:hypothetical protein